MALPARAPLCRAASLAGDEGKRVIEGRKLRPRPYVNRVLGRLAPLTIAVIPRAPIGDRRGMVWRETGLLQHSPQIHHDLDPDFLTMRYGEHLGLRAERNLELAFVLASHGSNHVHSDTISRHSMLPLRGWLKIFSTVSR